MRISKNRGLEELRDYSRQIPHIQIAKAHAVLNYPLENPRNSMMITFGLLILFGARGVGELSVR